MKLDVSAVFLNKFFSKNGQTCCVWVYNALSMNPSNTTFHFPEVRVVEASAGSGKTFALAKRYVQLLLNPDLHYEQVPIRNILAITFTNKAAFEMKARILDFLKKIALKSLSKNEEQEILAPINITKEKASEKAFRIMEELIHNYNFFQVQTIDAFINALLSGCAFKIGLSSNFRIQRNSLDYLEYSLDKMIDRASHDKKTLQTFVNFLDQYLFLENKTNWFPKKDMLALLFSLHHKSNIYGEQFFTHPLKTEDMIVKKRYILELMRELEEQLPDGTDSRFLKSLNGFLKKYSKGFDFDKVSDFFARENVPARKGVGVSSNVDKLWQKIRNELRKLSEAEAYSLFNPYIDVFTQVSEDFQKKASKDDVLFLEELNRKARNLFIEGAITVEELYYRLATRFHHYLVDEFQDTSVLQWKNLYLMIEEALSTGGSLFYVGDKKQAIYGFRGGEVRLFDQIQHEFEHFNVTHERLSINYRSQRAIVEFNNKVFSFSNLQRFIAVKEDYELKKKKKDAVYFTNSDLKDVENIFAGCSQEHLAAKASGYVNISYMSSEKKEERDAEIRAFLVALIKDLKKRYASSDIAILTRSNKDVEEMTSWLMEEGIFVESERTLNIKENSIIKELIAFLQFLNSPIDNVAFADFILGDVFSKASGIKSEELHHFIFSLRDRMREKKDFYIYMEFRKAYPDIWKTYVEEFFKGVGLYPLYELMITIIDRLNILRNFKEQQGFIMRFLEVIKMQEDETNDIASFLEQFEHLEIEKLFVNVADTNAITIMTIHKAKGLEFPVVILPSLGMEVQVGSGGGLGQQSYLMDFKEEHLELLRIKSKYLSFSGKLKGIHHREYVKSFISELNNIYVALTRAELELHVFIPKRVGNSFNLVNFLVPEDALEIGEPQKIEAKDKSVSRDSQRLKLPISSYYDWIGFLKDEFVDIEDLSSRSRILKGNILHFMLSRVGNIKAVNKDNMLKDILLELKKQYPYEENVAVYKEALTNILEAESLKRFFDIGDGEVFQEIDVVDAYGNTKRVDRLIVKKDEVWVIDYKSSRGQETQHKKQIKEYMKIMNDIYPKKDAKGFLVYLDSLEYEEMK